MPRSPFSSEELTEILARAEEISSQRSESLLHSNEIEAILDAAEEAGLNREATLQALRERLAPPSADIVAGELVFAKSDDGHYYPARLIGMANHYADIHFISGTKTKIGIGDIKPFTITPGLKLQFQEQTFNYWTEGEVTRYNDEGRSVTFLYWGKEITVSLEKVRQKKVSPLQRATSAVKWKILGLVIGSSAITGAIGFLIGYLAGR